MHWYPGCAPLDPGSIGQITRSRYSRLRQAIVGATVGAEEGELDGDPVGTLVVGALVGATVSTQIVVNDGSWNCQEAERPVLPS